MLAPILAAIGARRLRELTAADVQQALTVMAARYSTAAVAMGHNALTRVIRHAEARDLVARNVATLVDTPKGQAGRPSKSLTLEQASALLAAASDIRMHAYIALCLATGIRTEEARALRWEHINLGNPTLPYPPALPCGARSEPTATPKPKNPGAPSPCPTWPPTRCAPSNSSKPPTVMPLAHGTPGRISSSQPGPAAQWTPPTSAANSVPSARPLASEPAGRPANCATPSSP